MRSKWRPTRNLTQSAKRGPKKKKKKKQFARFVVSVSDWCPNEIPAIWLAEVCQIWACWAGRGGRREMGGRLPVAPLTAKIATMIRLTENRSESTRLWQILFEFRPPWEFRKTGNVQLSITQLFQSNCQTKANWNFEKICQRHRLSIPSPSPPRPVAPLAVRISTTMTNSGKIQGDPFIRWNEQVGQKKRAVRRRSANLATA